MIRKKWKPVFRKDHARTKSLLTALEWNVAVDVSHQVTSDPLGFVSVQNFQYFRTWQSFVLVDMPTKRAEAVCPR